MRLTGLSRGTIDRLVEAEKFPPKVELSPIRRGYNVGEVHLYLDDPSGYRPPRRRNEPDEDA
ncbi:helix-turn-helix transcriptional regulator [Rhizobium laguerreae]|uniref:helix-turn-helix transcriptional regulator n=1 Tax=Rhizobium laguerreae TaxID=1076926 RepID=UPI003CCE5D42